MTKQKKAKAAGPIDRHVGAHVRRRREAIRLSQDALGELLGITFQQIQKYERGQNRITVARLLQIADALRERPINFLPDRYR